MLNVEEVKRDTYGDWTHPELKAFYDKGGDDWEMVSLDEYKDWLESHGIETSVVFMEQDLDADDPAYIKHFEDGEAGSVGWNPEPLGPEWHMLSIHDTEEGPVVIWYRKIPD